MGLVGKSDITRIATEALRGGADMIQLRDKSSDDGDFLKYARLIKSATKRFRKPFIVNDRVDIARLAGADGVHLGQDDIPIREARKILGKVIIGISARNLKQARDAEKKGADYLGIGPIYHTKTKIENAPIGTGVLSRISKNTNIPCFAIGGITRKNIGSVRKSGGSAVAVASAAIKARNIYRSVENMKEAIDDTA